MSGEENPVVEYPVIKEIMGKDVVLEIIHEGIGEMAEVGTVVKCNLKGYFYSIEEKKTINDHPFEVLTNQNFTIGEGDTFPGLELALRHSTVGQKSRVFCASRFAYGFNGRNWDAKSQPAANTSNRLASVSIPPNTDLMYEIETISHFHESNLNPEERDKWEPLLEKASDEDERQKVFQRLQTYQVMILRKEAGNRWFGYKDYPRAAKAYSKATKAANAYFNGERERKLTLLETIEEKNALLEEGNNPIKEEEMDLLNIYITCLNNLAACKLSQGENLEAKDLCIKVLEVSPHNGKALLRAAKASLALDEYDECEVCLNLILKLQAVEEDIKASATIEMQKLKKAKAIYKEKSKEMQKRIAKKLFKSNNNTTANTSATSSPKDTQAPPDTADTPSNHEREAEVSSEEIPGDDKENSKESSTTDEKGKSSGDAIAKYNSSSSGPSSYNIYILLATSLAVLGYSVYFAYNHS